jgi:predicted transposase/invertase (TIGR01784 family)
VDTSFEEGLEEGEKVGLEKGINKGRTEEKMAMAKKLKEKGINIDIISETSGLLKEEIEKL